MTRGTHAMPTRIAPPTMPREIRRIATVFSLIAHFHLLTLVSHYRSNPVFNQTAIYQVFAATVPINISTCVARRPHSSCPPVSARPHPPCAAKSSYLRKRPNVTTRHRLVWQSQDAAQPSGERIMPPVKTNVRIREMFTYLYILPSPPAVLLNQEDARNETSDRAKALGALNDALKREEFEAFYAEDGRCYPGPVYRVAGDRRTRRIRYRRQKARSTISIIAPNNPRLTSIRLM